MPPELLQERLKHLDEFTGGKSMVPITTAAKWLGISYYMLQADSNFMKGVVCFNPEAKVPQRKVPREFLAAYLPKTRRKL